jgi:hypothetical protein
MLSQTFDIIRLSQLGLRREDTKKPIDFAVFPKSL